MTTITIRSRNYELEDLSDNLKLIAFDIGKITGEIEEAEYKLRTLSALREFLATQFENETDGSQNGSQSNDLITGN